MTADSAAHWTYRRRTVLTAAIAAIALCSPAGASALADPVDLQVIDRDTGQPLRVWRHNGRTFVAGEPGKRYGLRVTNNTDGRVLVVMSVDGVNVITGETAGYDQRGYVFGPYQSNDIDGWRKSNTEIAAFSFAPLPKSYAARTGRPSEVGVIGLAVFKEKTVPPVTAEISRAPKADGRDQPRGEAGRAKRDQAAQPASPAARVEEPSARSAAPFSDRSNDAVVTARRREDRLGTAHGAREWSVSRVVTFERATRRPQSVRQIEYDTYVNLVASGVIPPSPYAERRPRPFPLRPGYTPDPPAEY